MPNPDRFAVTITLAADASAPAAARRSIGSDLAGRGCRELVDDAALVASELVTNAVRYGGGDPIDVEVTGDEDRVRIAVTDSNTAELPRVLSVADDSLGGRGMAIVAALAAAWGAERRASRKTVWAELPTHR